MPSSRKVELRVQRSDAKVPAAEVSFAARKTHFVYSAYSRRIPRAPIQPTRDDIIARARMKVTIKEWNAVAAWRWDMPDDDVCGICRNPYDSTCSKCKFPGDECPLCKSNCLKQSIFACSGC